MDVFADFTARLDTVLEGLVNTGQLSSLGQGRITVEPPRDATHGDLATNAAMVHAKPSGMKPRDLAEMIVAQLTDDPDIASAEIAGPGFINLRLAPGYWRKVLAAILKAGDSFGRSDLGQGKPVNVEYVSANPTGPMHVGHCRGAVVGDAIAALLDFAGYEVAREYYINDAGAQVDVLAKSAYLRYREACGEDIGVIPEGLYPGNYLKPVGVAIKAAHGDAFLVAEEAEWLPVIRNLTIDAMMEMIRSDLAALGIEQDVFFSERSLIGADGIGGASDRVAETIADFQERGLVYEGRLPPPKGQLPDDWEDREQLLFRATEFGDDVDRSLMKSDGSYTYFASDIAYHRDKYLRGFNWMIDIWGADHGGYVKRMTSAVRAATADEGQLDVRLCQLVKLFRAGEPVRMSKRSGDFVTLRDLVEEVGRDVVRFIMLTRKSDAPIDFDFAKVVEQSKDNPVFYVQYAHARVHSVFRQAAEPFSDLTFPIDAAAAGVDSIESIEHPDDLALIQKLAQFPRLVESAAQSLEPHRVAFYLYELASTFHGLWNRGKDMPQLRFIHENDKDLTRARLLLIQAVGNTIQSGLGVLGVTAVKEMR